MERITISLDAALGRQLAELIDRKGYRNRSEAFRDLLRQELERDRLESGAAGSCIACLSYVYNHHRRDLSGRLTEVQHRHHDLGLSTLHVHLDHDDCMEAVILQGAIDEVRAFADAIMAEPGVRHGRLHVVPVDLETSSHGGHAHVHRHPIT
ncbi:MAG: nickel-responsive transcriptional regulator NikR [Gammaproteobacteria bacterium]|nr:nickel-responsive transcriptional regulator NikR [Gammaproteobacteria bacterium]